MFCICVYDIDRVPSTIKLYHFCLQISQTITKRQLGTRSIESDISK